MIPKIIHYCWFGGKDKPRLAQKCIRSWKKYCPDYQIIEWNEGNYDLSSAPLYVRQACEAKKWAFVTDYVRLDVVCRHGGIYLDTDVEVIKPMDEFLQYDAFFGFESTNYINTGSGFGAAKNNALIQELMDSYSGMAFLSEDGSLNTKACPEINWPVFHRFGFEKNGTTQIINNTAAFSPEYFSPVDYNTFYLHKTGNTHTIHWFSGSWQSAEEKQLVEMYCRMNRKEALSLYLHRKLDRILGRGRKNK